MKNIHSAILLFSILFLNGCKTEDKETAEPVLKEKTEESVDTQQEAVKSQTFIFFFDNFSENQYNPFEESNFQLVKEIDYVPFLKSPNFDEEDVKKIITDILAETSANEEDVDSSENMTIIKELKDAVLNMETKSAASEKYDELVANQKVFAEKLVRVAGLLENIANAADGLGIDKLEQEMKSYDERLAQISETLNQSKEENKGIAKSLSDLEQSVSDANKKTKEQEGDLNEAQIKLEASIKELQEKTKESMDKISESLKNVDETMLSHSNAIEDLADNKAVTAKDIDTLNQNIRGLHEAYKGMYEFIRKNN